MTDFLTTEAEVTLTWTPILIGLAIAGIAACLITLGLMPGPDGTAWHRTQIRRCGWGLLVAGVLMALTGVSVSAA